MDIATALDHFIKGQVPPRWVRQQGKWGRHARPSDTGRSGWLAVARARVAAGVRSPVVTPLHHTALPPPRSKINLGIGAYGRSWLLADPTQTAVGSSAPTAGPQGACTGAPA